MLLLFDIDATLLSTRGAGVAAMREAASRRFGVEFSTQGIEFAGRLDPLIIGDMLRRHGVDDTPQHHAAVRAEYARLMQERMAAPGAASALPGVHELLESVWAAAGAGRGVVGLLTGNYAETGRMKLHAAGIDSARFAVAAWGDDSPTDPPTRDSLPAVAAARASRLSGREFRGRSIVIIGDTPHDVRAAKACGGRCLAVATGSYSAGVLRAAGADVVVENLSNTQEIGAWLWGDV
ncbi:MAG: HAD hydrolase-like protein [Phycisphaeraceae bacterium]|nr:HAD hydrolase-like protein [Phycisphaeraceae bacterium]